MAFTYDLSSADATILATSKVRLRIGDTVENAGPLPGGANFSDEELAEFYASEGSHVMRTAAAAFEALAGAWAAHAGAYSLGPESETFQQAKAYEERARKLRERYGYAEDDTADAFKGAFGVPVRPAGQA